MRIPVCIGMPRSASRMTWQIAKLLSPNESNTWQRKMRVNQTEGIGRPTITINVPWPFRSHEYVVGSDPVIYTYRDPVEAYLSLISRANDPGRTDDNEYVKEILSHRGIQAQLKRDELQGRQVLWIKYEDYYENDAMRLSLIENFLDMNIADAKRFEILQYVSLEQNINRAETIRSLGKFKYWEDPRSGIQAQHINKVTRGRVGAYKDVNPNVHFLIMTTGDRTNLGQLKIFARSLGYKY